MRNRPCTVNSLNHKCKKKQYKNEVPSTFLPHEHFWTISFTCGLTENAWNARNCTARPSGLWTQQGRCGQAHFAPVKLCPKQGRSGGLTGSWRHKYNARGEEFWEGSGRDFSRHLTLQNHTGGCFAWCFILNTYTSARQRTRRGREKKKRNIYINMRRSFFLFFSPA